MLARVSRLHVSIEEVNDQRGALDPPRIFQEHVEPRELPDDLVEDIRPSIDYLERAFDEGEYGWHSSRPYIDGTIQSTTDPDMPPGTHIMSCFSRYTPYKLRRSNRDAEAKTLGDTVQRTLESFIRGFGKLAVATAAVRCGRLATAAASRRP